MRGAIHSEAQTGKRTFAATIPAFFIGLPALLFYGTIFTHLKNLPLYDDYDAILEFFNQMAQAKGVAAKFLVFLAGQNNEYKLFFVHGLTWAEVALLGHINFVILCAVGNSAVLVLAFQLWLMFLPDEKDMVRRLGFYVPVAWLLFQLEYWETLNWAMASLQNLWVIVFSFGAIQCMLGRSRRSYAASLLLYALAISASGNGFLLLPIGLMIFAIRHQMSRAAGWITVTAVCIAAYAYRYNIMSSQAPSHGSVLATLQHLRLDYAIAFVGNSGAVASAWPFGVFICMILGAGLLLFFGWLGWRGFYRRNPASGCCVVFLLLTAVGVAGIRSEFGIGQSMAPRYNIYGVLLLILAWSAFAGEFLERRSSPLLNNGPYLMMTVMAIVFSLCVDQIGSMSLARREQDTVRGMQEFEQSATSDTGAGPVVPFIRETPGLAVFRSRTRGILQESIRFGVYSPPRY